MPEKPRTTRPLGISLIGVPGFEPGTSATRTQRSTGLSHAPEPTGNYHGRGGIDLASLGRLAEMPPRHLPTHSCRSTQTHSVIFCEDHVGSNATVISTTDGVGFEPTRA